jgi:hypothetical protein
VLELARLEADIKSADLAEKYAQADIKIADLAEKYAQADPKFIDLAEKYAQADPKFIDLAEKYAQADLKIADLADDRNNSTDVYEELPAGPHDANVGRLGSGLRGVVAALELRSRELRLEEKQQHCFVKEPAADQQYCFMKEPAAITLRLYSPTEFHFDGRLFRTCITTITPSEWDHVLRMINHIVSRLREELPAGPQEAKAVQVGSICRRDAATFELDSDWPEIENLRFMCTHAPSELDCCSSGPGGSLDANRLRCRSELETSRLTCAHTPTELDAGSSGSGSPWTQKGSAAEYGTPPEAPKPKGKGKGKGKKDAAPADQGEAAEE